MPLSLNTYKRINAYVVMPIPHEIAAHPKILDVVESVLEPDILLYSKELIIKESQTKYVVTMHQDLACWGLGEIDGSATV